MIQNDDTGAAVPPNSASVTGPFTVQGDLTVTGNESVGGNENVTGNLVVGGTGTIGGALNIGGAVSAPSLTLAAVPITAAPVEINRLSGVTSAIQTQLNGKSPLGTPAPSAIAPVNGKSAVIGVSLSYSREDHVHPTTGIDVTTFATGGSGSSGSPWTGWETAVNALPVNVRIYFSAGADGRHGNYTQASRIDVKDRWRIEGDGRGATVITSIFVGTAFRINTVPTPALGYVSIRHLSIVNTNAANTGSGVLIVGAFFSDISDVRITGFRYGCPTLNAETFAFNRVTWEFQTRSCTWIVNNGDYNPTYADLDYSAYAGGGSNAVSYTDCEFNGASGTPTPVLVIDDGGYSHNWTNCNFNGGVTAFRIAGVSTMRCVGSDFESQSGDMIVTATTTYNSAAGVGGSSEVLFESNMMTPDPTKAIVDATACESLILIANRMNTPIAAVKNSSGCNLFNLRSVMNTGPLYSGTPASYFDLASNNSSNALATSLPISTADNLSVTTIGKGLRVAAGTNGKLGSSVLVGGTIVVANTSVTASTKIFLSRSVTGGTTGDLSYTKSNGVSFTITSSSGTDTSTIEWMLVEAL